MNLKDFSSKKIVCTDCDASYMNDNNLKATGKAESYVQINHAVNNNFHGSQKEIKFNSSLEASEEEVYCLFLDVIKNSNHERIINESEIASYEFFESFFGGKEFILSKSNKEEILILTSKKKNTVSEWRFLT